MRYRLRTLFIALTAVCFLLGFVVNEVRSIRQRRTSRMLSRLALETEMQVMVTHELPAIDIQAIVNELNSNGSHLPPWFLERRIAYPGLEQGMDAWGRRVIVESRNGYTVWFRSKGPNGIDEEGLGDDIQRSINCLTFVDTRPRPSRALPNPRGVLLHGGVPIWRTGKMSRCVSASARC